MSSNSNGIPPVAGPADNSHRTYTRAIARAEARTSALGTVTQLQSLPPRAQAVSQVAQQAQLGSVLQQSQLVRQRNEDIEGFINPEYFVAQQAALAAYQRQAAMIHAAEELALEAAIKASQHDIKTDRDYVTLITPCATQSTVQIQNWEPPLRGLLSPSSAPWTSQRINFGPCRYTTYMDFILPALLSSMEMVPDEVEEMLEIVDLDDVQTLGDLEKEIVNALNEGPEHTFELQQRIHTAVKRVLQGYVPLL